MESIKNYAKYGIAGRFTDLLCQMEEKGYLEPFCKNTGRDYNKYKGLTEIMNPIFAGDYSDYEAVKSERKRIKEFEKDLQEMEKDLGFNY